MKTAIFLLIAMMFGFAGAEEAPLSEVKVFLDQQTTQPGSTLPLSVKIKVAEGWHTYAKEPGDSGMPPSIKVFYGDEEMLVDQWKFPPHETFSGETGTTYGYEGEVVLTGSAIVPEHVAEEAIELRVVVKWMICLDACMFFKDEQTVFVKLERGESI